MVTEFSWQNGARAALSLTFDDGRMSQLEHAVPLLNRFGLRGTFYVLPSALEKSLDAWRDVVAMGHEIGNHSFTHPCSGNFRFARENGLESYTLDQIDKDLDKATHYIEKVLGVTPMTFAYPCGQKFVGRGELTRSYVPLVARKFLAGRGWHDEWCNVPGHWDLAQLFAVSLDCLGREEALVWVEKAIEEGGWLIFAGHDVFLENRTRQTVVESTLQAVLEYVLDKKGIVWCDTVSAIATYIRGIEAKQ